jgi:penicillin-binding protein 1C
VQLTPQPSIAAPADGTVIAIDPDIPAERQRVRFAARHANGALWQLDGRDLGPGSASQLWKPVAGPHVLRLVDADRRTIDQISFLVRPAAPERG